MTTINPKQLAGARKVPMSAVPANVLAEIAVAMHEGALKYGRHNYRATPIQMSDYYDGVMRHMMAWWEGEDIDPDTCPLDENGNPDLSQGVSHITKAITSLVVLRDAMMQGLVIDNRPPRSVAFFPDLNARTAALLDKYGERKPRHYMITDTDLMRETSALIRQAANVS